jgi:hypothetical protein
MAGTVTPRPDLKRSSFRQNRARRDADLEVNLPTAGPLAVSPYPLQTRSPTTRKFQQNFNNGNFCKGHAALNSPYQKQKSRYRKELQNRRQRSHATGQELIISFW